MASVEIKLGMDRIRSQVAELCATRLCAERVMAEGFTSDAAVLGDRLGLCAEMLAILGFEGGFPAEGFSDMDDLLSKIGVVGAFLDPGELLRLRSALGCAVMVTAYFDEARRTRYPLLGALSARVVGFSDIVAGIDRIVDRFGEIKPNASEELSRISSSLRDCENQVAKRLRQILSKAKGEGFIEAESEVTFREGRAVIPVPAANKRKVRGFVHDESSSGRTFYIEPEEVVELNNDLRELEYARRREIVRILTAFTDALRPRLDELHDLEKNLLEIELVYVKGKWGVANGAVVPLLSRDERRLELRQARHPLLVQALKREGKPIVPLDLALDPKSRILVISGPNAGGKSVCLKTVGLLQYMFQCGFPVPALENSELVLFDGIFVDIGDDQSIDNDLSTYSSHLLSMKEMLSRSTARSLVLIDEFGSGTEPVIGGAIAEAILEKMAERKCYAVVTTHYSNLKFFATSASGVVNGAMTFDVANIKPLFKLETGTPGSSFAVEIARRIGLPEQIIRIAGEKAGSEVMNLEKQLREIARDRRYWEQKRDRIRLADKRVEELEAKLAGELEKVKEQRAHLLKDAREQAQKLLTDANKAIEGAVREIRESQAEKESVRLIRKGLDQAKESVAEDLEKDEQIREQIERIEARRQRRNERKAQAETAADAAPEPEKPREPEIGSKVRIEGQSMPGEVVGTVKGGKYRVAFGQIITTVERSRIEVVSESEYKKHRKAPVSKIDAGITGRKLNFKDNIDLRGSRAAEALTEVEEFIDNAIMLGVGEVRILHGKGTGALKEEVRRYLKTVPQVLSAADEHADRGGSGITVVTLRT